MKKSVILIIALLQVFYVSAQPGSGKIRNKIERKIEAQKVAFITRALDLTPAEAEKFWPLYNEYSKKMRELRNVNKINSKNLTEEDANRLIDEYFENEQKKLILKKNYYDKFRAVLPATKVVKLHFAEKKFKLKLLKRLKKHSGKERRKHPR